MLKDNLNEFEADWAAMPSVEQNHLDRLRNKTILISGHKIARCLCYALLYLNETKNLNINVVFLSDSVDELAPFSQEIAARKDFRFIDFNSDTEYSADIDYAIHTGLCCEEIDNFGIQLKKEILYAQKFAENIGKAKAVLLSDSRVYGNAEPHRIYAENEYAKLTDTDKDSFEGQLLRAIECYMNCESKQRVFSLTTLRTGIVLGAYSGVNTAFDSIFEAVAKNNTVSIFNSVREYSVVYINDVFKSIFYSLTEISDNQVYNVSQANITTGILAATLRKIYGNAAKIELISGNEFSYCAVSSSKLKNAGFEFSVSLDTALAMCVMSHMADNSIMTLPHTHGGRLASIQRIQLGMLLEVDRICRKHNIKYFLGGGTLLGAIRHKGFIPWDDDSDIMMLREDYDKFSKIVESELPPSLSFQSNKNDKSCFYEFSKIRLNGSTFATSFSKEHTEMHNGIALDIFCHDATANSAFGRKLHIAATLFTRALVFNKWNNRKTENGSKFQSAVTNFCIKLFPIRFSLWLMNRSISFFKRKKNVKFLYDGMGRNVYNGAFPAEFLDEVIYVDFESVKLPVPKRYDEYLRFLYGDYTQLAPLSTRLGCHEILLCDIGEYNNFKHKKSFISQMIDIAYLF